ncbi:MAG: GDYXXLXY domain-containing protein [Bacteroidota bacterium]
MFRNILFTISMLLMIAVPIQMIYTYENILDEGEVHRFKPRPIDPYNPFQGRYVRLYFEDRDLSYEGAEDIFERGSKAYVSLEKDSVGISHARDIFLSPPSDQPYVEVEVSSVGKEKVWFRYPFSEYYMNEEMAPLAEIEIREHSRRDEVEVYVDVRVKNGQGIIEQLYVEDQAIEDFLKEQME